MKTLKDLEQERIKFLREQICNMYEEIDRTVENHLEFNKNYYLELWDYNRLFNIKKEVYELKSNGRKPLYINKTEEIREQDLKEMILILEELLDTVNVYIITKMKELKEK